MNTDSTISLTFVRDRVKAFYDIMDTKKDAYIDLMILDSVREAQSYKYVTQEAFTLDICDHKAQLPCNYKTVLVVIPSCSDGCTPMVYSNFQFDGVQGNCERFKMPDRWKIMDGYLVFPSDFPHDSIDIYCDVYILGEDGFPLLREAHLPYYIRYASYWVGLKIGDARYKAFANYSSVRRNITHNEQVDVFHYEQVSIVAITKQLGLSGYSYRGTYNNGVNSYGGI